MIYDKIYKLPSFKRQYKAVLKLSVASTIQNLIWETPLEELEKELNWNNLLSIASVLSQSENSLHLEAALRISQTCLVSNTSETQKAGAVVVLETLTNIPALELAVKRQLIQKDYESQLPLPFKIQTNSIKMSNSISLDEKIISLNRFQKKVFDASVKNNSLSISAPTSAGKSFILYQLLLQELKFKEKNIVYIVPTRALISQVESDLRKLIKSNNLSDVNLTTVPLELSNEKSNNLFVFTQERLHWFLVQNSNPRIDFLIVDEAHKIDNGNRGVLLQRKIEDVIQINPETKIFFSSPFTSNPEYLFQGLNTTINHDIINTDFVSVNQNLLYVKQVPRKPMEWELSVVTKEDSTLLGTVKLKNRPTTEAKKIAFLSDSISKSNGGSLIYANGAAEAEKYAKLLMDMSDSDSISEEVEELIKLVKKTIHSKYSLAKVLEKGIAFHYGNMPLLIRQEIEHLFKENHIKFLVCTSTLLEGVNLPATSVFIRKPTRGRRNPLNENDFWNLAGRAGRWGKEFSGNIICIEPDEWEIKPSPNKRKQKIERALDVIKRTKKEEFFNFIKNRTPREIAESNQDLEFAFSYYYSRFIQDDLEQNTTYKKEIVRELEKIKQSITIPDSIIFRNPGISPIAQQELYDYLKTKKDSVEQLVPVYPEDEDSYNEYIKLIGRIGKTLARFPPQLNASRAVLLINWMKGKPLSYLISSSHENYKKKGLNKSIDSVCRETMDNVENFARFRFAKESSCYVDILRQFLIDIDRKDLLEEIPELNLWLEFGVSQKTQLSLLSLGLSRNTVITISEYISNTELNQTEVLQWLQERDIQSLELSPIMVSDIKKAIGTT
jgi:replicative superfamily II helicase